MYLLIVTFFCLRCLYSFIVSFKARDLFASSCSEVNAPFILMCLTNRDTLSVHAVFDLYRDVVENMFKRREGKVIQACGS